MQYSRIEDVWKISETPSRETCSPQPTTYQNKPHIREHMNNDETDYLLSETATISKEECEHLLRRVLKSEKCKKYLRNRYRPRILEKLYEILDENRDIIVLVLIIYSLILFFRLIY